MNFKQPPRGGMSIRRAAQTRRQFLGAAAGAAGLALGWSSGLARAGPAGDPVPIPGGFEIGGTLFHVFGPGFFGEPEDEEPATITHFNGFIGLAYIDGMCTETNHTTGAVRRLPFLASDMRFMQGVYRDKTGRVRQGAFALV
jgi:hypothetical protein